MSNVIGFLEKMGQDAQSRHATTEEMELALNGAGIDPQVQAAILGRSQTQLESLLGARTNVYCLVAPGKKEDDEDEDSPDRDDDEITGSNSTVRHMATSG